ncbi:response regulator transcription factor [Streptomyces sp. NPDC002596]
MSALRSGKVPQPVAEQSWDVTFCPAGEPTEATGLDPELVRRIAAFHASELESVTFLWIEDGAWTRCRLTRCPPTTGAEAETTVTLLALDGPPAGLTAREIDVISLVALGLSNREISSRLGTSVRTVTTQMERLLKKLGQESRAGLGALAVDRALVRLPVEGAENSSVQVRRYVGTRGPLRRGGRVGGR